VTVEEADMVAEAVAILEAVVLVVHRIPPTRTVRRL
jgi:hypothetical protein